MKVVTLNVEQDKHWENIVPFLTRELPDTVCFQELFEHDAEMIAERFGYDYVYVPVTKKRFGKNQKSFAKEGQALFSKFPITDKHIEYYWQPGSELPEYSNQSVSSKQNTYWKGIIWGTIRKNENAFTVGTTHFTWTPDGKPDESQHRDIASLFKITDKIPDLILCGDFNVPRGKNEIYKKLVERFRDNVPLEIKTTLDLDNHHVQDPVEKKRMEKFVVDYIFSTPEYVVKNVRCEYGVSDHAALIGHVARVGS